MMKSERRTIGKVLIFAVLFATFVFVCVGYASATEVYVPDNYEKIQWAVDAASPYDTIIVRDGTYTENVAVTVNDLTIRSENGSATCIVQAADPNGHVFSVTADYVNISGFTVQNATGSGKAGIRLGNADHCTVSNISASNNYYGIDLYESGSNTIMDNIANSNNWHGIRLRDSNYNNLTNNTANLNGIAGIALRASTCNTLINNSVSDNEIGFAVPPDHPINMSYFDNSVDASNLVNGKPFYYYFNQSDRLIEGLNAGHLSIPFCTNFTVRNVDVSGGDGIFLRGTTNSTITDSISVNNTFGIMVDSSDGNNITNNNLSNNFVGIDMGYSQWNNISNNTLNSNNASGTNFNTMRSLLNGTGIIMSDSNNNHVSNNTVSFNNGYGIILREYSQNNTIIGNNASSNDVTGISLNFCNDSTIIGNIGISNSKNGFGLNNSNDNVISNNNASSNNNHGIGLNNSNNNTIANNTASSNDNTGIKLDYSSYNNLTNNTASNNGEYGIWLRRSPYNTLRGNVMDHNGVINLIGKDTNPVEYWNNDIDTSNTVNGLPVYYIYNQSDLIIDGFITKRIYVVGCDNITVRNINFSNGDPITFVFTNNSLVENCTVTNNNCDGFIFTGWSTSNTVINNNASYNKMKGFGVRVHMITI